MHMMLHHHVWVAGHVLPLACMSAPLIRMAWSPPASSLLTHKQPTNSTAGSTHCLVDRLKDVGGVWLWSPFTTKRVLCSGQPWFINPRLVCGGLSQRL
jgi:hypothetical protein